MSDLFSLITKKKDNEKKKQAEADYIRITQYAAKLRAWFIQEGVTVKDAVVLLQSFMNGMNKTMESKTRPIIEGWNDKPLKDFYAAEIEKETSRT